MDEGRPVEASRSHPVVVALLLLAAAAAWCATAVRMAGMDAGPGTPLGSLGWFAGAWTVMMGAMMLPSLAPTAALYASLDRRGRWLFVVTGYLLSWSAAGVAAYAVFEIGTQLSGSALGWNAGGRYVAAGVLVMAAGYQLSPMKHACLTRCRSARQLLTGRPLDGWAGAFRAGVRSGRACIGSSWAMMAALFALGVMSVTWMALVAALVACEKLAPRPRTATLAAALALAVLAAGVATAPQTVPGLMIPADHSAMSMSGNEDGGHGVREVGSARSVE